MFNFCEAITKALAALLDSEVSVSVVVINSCIASKDDLPPLANCSAPFCPVAKSLLASAACSAICPVAIAMVPYVF